MFCHKPITDIWFKLRTSKMTLLYNTFIRTGFLRHPAFEQQD